MTSYDLVILAVTACAAGAVNGALGYGFSSLTVPVGLLFLPTRALNPALVIVEVCLNASVLWLNRASLANAARRVLPLVAGLIPGVAFGTVIVAWMDPDALRLLTFITLLPLILLQAGGCRRAISRESTTGFVFGAAVGVLYAVTTISGPPLAVALNNQGLVAGEFRAALAVVRVAESAVTSIAYAGAGFFNAEHLILVLVVLPSALVGIPLGAWAIRRLHAETFRRVCMSFDAWIVAFGIAMLLRSVYGAGPFVATTVVATVGAADAWLLYRFFGRKRVALHVS